MSMYLAGGASTQSRGRRPLPDGYDYATSDTANSIGVRELVEFQGLRGMTRRECVSWVVGQSGILWGHGPYPPEIMREFTRWEVPGSYGSRAEFALVDALETALDGLFAGDGRLACRFFADGGTAMAAAARVARAATERVPIASFGYHGASEEWAHEPVVAGVLPEVVANHLRFDWGDVARVQALAKTCAAICVEVPPVEPEDARAFLTACRVACNAGGALLILDEVVTGFRLALGGAAELYGVKPDIACYGKAMSAIGLVSAIVGRADVVGRLGDDVFCSTTFGGHPLTTGIAAATVRHLTAYRHGIYGDAGHLRQIGRALMDGLNALGVRTVGQPERSVMQFENDETRRAFCSEMIARGVIMDRPQFATLAHTPADVERTLEAAEAVFREAVLR